MFKYIRKKINMARTEEIVNSVSRISSGTKISGELFSTNDLRIDGCFSGKIFSRGRIVVGESAEVSGELLCSNADIWGKMKGDIYVKDTLSMKNGAKVDGNLNINKIVVELGVAFNGTCRMITTEEFDKTANTVCSQMKVAGDADGQKKQPQNAEKSGR